MYTVLVWKNLLLMQTFVGNDPKELATVAVKYKNELQDRYPNDDCYVSVPQNIIEVS
jgi:hypothetical protein